MYLPITPSDNMITPVEKAIPQMIDCHPDWCVGKPMKNRITINAAKKKDNELMSRPR